MEGFKPQIILSLQIYVSYMRLTCTIAAELTLEGPYVGGFPPQVVRLLLLFFFITVYSPLQFVRGFTLSDLLDNPWS